jgi:hypothetical protein
MIRWIVAAGLLFFSSSLAWSIATSRRAHPPEASIGYRPIQMLEDGYVSSQACKACHPSQYESWHKSFHRTMTQMATPETVRADFDGVRVNVVPGNPIVLERRGGELWTDLGDPDWAGANGDRPRIRRQIVMVTGSHHQQVYWYRTGHSRVLGQLPATYLIAEGRWIPRDAALLHPPLEQPLSETGRWNAVCVNCHATHGRRLLEEPESSTTAADTRMVELGIACESCHGPAGGHTQANRSPLRRYWQYLAGEADRSAIVQPARLPPALSSQVCGQCHAVWEYYDRDSERDANEHGLPYRPGDDLSATRFIVNPAADRDSPTLRGIVDGYEGYLEGSFWPDGMIRVSGREYNGLIASPCFVNAAGPQNMLSCFSCHTMHQGPDDGRSIERWAGTHQVAPRMDGNAACLQCHAPLGADLTDHTKHRPDSSGSLCYNCHMPYTTYGLLRGMRSHQISSPSVAASVETGRPNACNGCHLDKTLAWAAERLEAWYGLPPVGLNEDEETIAASLLWLLRGDAGQRALAAWSMGWEPAQQVSGTSWMGAPLAMLLDDPYDAVRFVAERSLRSLPGFDAFRYDFLASPNERAGATLAVLAAVEQWRRSSRPGERRTDPSLLLDANGATRMDAIIRLGRDRDNRPVVLRE